MTWLDVDNMKQHERALVGKAGVALRRLASGFPGPQEPVQGKDVREKILGHSEEAKYG